MSSLTTSNGSGRQAVLSNRFAYDAFERSFTWLCRNLASHEGHVYGYSHANWPTPVWMCILELVAPRTA